MSLLRDSILAVTAVAVCGCASRPPSVKPVYDAGTHELVRLDYDYDADGQVDVRTYMAQGRAVRLEGDTNKDGLVDRWEYYDATGALARLGGSSQGDGVEDTWLYRSGPDVRLEISTRRNRRVDRREFYRGNVLLRTESDTNQDGLPDTWEEYQGGSLSLLSIDEGKHGGRPSRRIVYAAGGDPRIEIDRDGEGHFVPAGADATTRGTQERSYASR